MVPSPSSGADGAIIADGAANWPFQCPAEARAPTPGAERSGPEKQPTGLAFEYPRDPEHRSYSDRGEPGAEDRARGDGHTGRQGPSQDRGRGFGAAVTAGEDIGDIFLLSQTSWRC